MCGALSFKIWQVEKYQLQYVLNLKGFVIHKSSKKQDRLTRNIYSENISRTADVLQAQDSCVETYFRQPGGSMCFWGLWLFIPPTISTVLQDFKHSLRSPDPAVLTLLGNQAPGPNFIFLPGVPPQHCTGLICTHIKYCIGILFFQYLLFYFQTRPPLKDRALFWHTDFIRWRRIGPCTPSESLFMHVQTLGAYSRGKCGLCSCSCHYLMIHNKMLNYSKQNLCSRI